jgi:hypothetical protein
MAPSAISDALAEMQKATVTYVMCLSVYTSVRTEQLPSHWTDFGKIWDRGLFLKSVEKVQFWLTAGTNSGHFT